MAPTRKQSTLTAPRRGRPTVAIPVGPHVLVIEDDDTVRSLIRTIVERAGMRVTATADGPSAIAAVGAAGRPPDAMIVDIVLPGPNGIAVVAALRSRWPGIPAVFVTGHPADLPDTGDDLLLEKPFSPAALVSGVQRAMAGLQHRASKGRRTPRAALTGVDRNARQALRVDR